MGREGRINKHASKLNKQQQRKKQTLPEKSQQEIAEENKKKEEANRILQKIEKKFKENVEKRIKGQ